LLFVLACAAGCRSATDGVLRLRLGHVGTAGSHFDLGCQRFKQIVEVRLAGRVEIQVYPASQLGSDKEMLVALRLGALDVHVPSSALHSVEPVLRVFDAPFLIADREQLRRLVEGPVGAEIRKRLRERGLELLGFWENGFRMITNNVRPIVRPEDLSGIKLRTPNDPGRVRLFRVLGANPTSMPFGELFSALRQGVVDGQENPLSQIVSARLYEVQKFLSLSRHVYSPAYPIMNRAFYESLPDDVKRVLREAGEEVGRYHRALGQEKDAAFLDVCRKHAEVAEIDRAAFVAAARPILDEMEAQLGEDLFEALMKEVAPEPGDSVLAGPPR
jgi:tripartite ATP-independent transporter DctP family solute receptor